MLAAAPYFKTRGGALLRLDVGGCLGRIWAFLRVFLDYIVVHLCECSRIFFGLFLECFSLGLACFRIVLGCSWVFASFAQPESASKSHVLSGSLLIRFTGYRLCRRPLQHSMIR